MASIIITDEQAKAITSAGEPVELRAPNGSLVGMVTQIFSAEDILEFRRRSSSADPRRSTAEVLEHLRSLEQT